MTASTGRKLDPIAALLALLTAVALVTAGWVRFGARPSARRADPPSVGALLPPLRLLDPTTAEPVLLIGLRGKVVWITFWSPAAPNSRAQVDALEPTWKRLKGRPLFACALVAVDGAPIGAVQARLPTYRATPATRKTFGAEGRNLPLHVLVDDDGRIAVLARGAEPETLNNLARQAERRLDALEPFGNTRFASMHENRLTTKAQRTQREKTREEDRERFDCLNLDSSFRLLCLFPLCPLCLCGESPPLPPKGAP